MNRAGLELNHSFSLIQNHSAVPQCPTSTAFKASPTPPRPLLYHLFFMSVLQIKPRAPYMPGKCYILSPWWVCSGFVFNATGSSYVAQTDFEPALLSHILRLQSWDPHVQPCYLFCLGKLGFVGKLEQAKHCQTIYCHSSVVVSPLQR